MKNQKTPLLHQDGFQTILASLACILGGLIVGYLVLLLIEPSGAFEAIMAVMKSFLRYPGALKLKYARDDISSQVIDLMRSTMTTDFIYAYNYAINGMGLIYRDLVTKNNKDFASAVKSKEKAGLKNLEKVLDVFRGLDG